MERSPVRLLSPSEHCLQEILGNIMDYRSYPDNLEPCLPQLGSQKCRFTWGRHGHARISPVCPSTKGNRRNLLATLSCPAWRSGCILQQYQQTLPKETHSSQAMAMAQHLGTTSSQKHPGWHRNRYSPHSFHP